MSRRAGTDRRAASTRRKSAEIDNSSAGHGWFVSILAATLPPIGALALESVYLDTSLWSLLYPAVFISSWLGGLAAGVASTMLSAVLMCWFIVPQRYTVGATDPRDFLIAVVFVGMGITLSVLHSRIRRATRDAAAALGESRRANDELSRAMHQRRIFLALIENSSDFIGISDEHGTPQYVNLPGRRMVGLAPDFPIEQTTVPEYYPPSVREFVESVIVKNVKEKGFWRGETFFRHWQTEQSIPVDDTHFWIKEPDDGRIIGIGTITRDISELKHARDEAEAVVEQLKRTTDDLRDAQQLAHIGSWRWDRSTDEVRWSEELYRIYGRDPASPAPRMNVAAIYTPESKAALQAAIDKILVDGEPYEMDLEIVRPDGVARSVFARGSATRDGAGQIVSLNGTAQDVTELRELQRLREEWMSVIAHDLRQPIGVIKMAAELLPELHTGASAESEREMTERIHTAAAGLARLVDDLLDASRIEAHRLTLRLAAVDALAMVRETVDRLSHMTNGRRVCVSHGPDLQPVFADPARMEQVLGNLLSNAVKYGDATGDIGVRVDRHDEEIEIAVSNPGRGIPAEEIPLLFDRFARTKESRRSSVPGLGIGLYVVKGLVEAHHGRIWAESVPGKTTTFHFTLPVAKPDEQHTESEQRRVA